MQASSLWAIGHKHGYAVYIIRLVGWPQHVFLSLSHREVSSSHAKPAPSIAADIDPMVTDMFIQCRNVLSLAAEPQHC